MLRLKNIVMFNSELHQIKIITKYSVTLENYETGELILVAPKSKLILKTEIKMKPELI